MTRLVTDSCELGIGTSASNASGFTVTTNNTAAVPSIDTTIVKHGEGSYKVIPATSVTGYLRWALGSATALGTGLYARAYVYFGSLPTAASTTIMQINDSGGVAQVGARLTSAGKLQFWRELATAAQIGSNSAATIVAGQWYRIEMYCSIGTGAVDAGELRLDDVTVASATAQTWGEAGLQTVDVGWRTAPGAGGLALYADSVAINDSTGTQQNTWPGDSIVVTLRPVADISRTGWTAGAGGTTNLWDALNNRPPTAVALASATNTSQIKDLAANTTDAVVVECESYASKGLDLAARINAVQAYLSHSADSATATNVRIQVTLNPAEPSATNATVTPAAAAGAWPTEWYRIRTTGLVGPVVSLAQRPQLTITKNTSSATLTQMVAGAGIVVDYTRANRVPGVVGQAVQRAANW